MLIQIFSSLILSNSALATSTDTILDTIDGQRAAQHAATSEQLAQLNYLRLKIFAINNDAKAFTTTANEIAKDCGPTAAAEKMESCHARLSEAVRLAEARHFALGQLILSNHYLNIQRQVVSQGVGIESLVDQTRAMLDRFLEASRPLRRTFALKVARLKYEKLMVGANSESDKAQLEMRCGFEPVSLGRELIALQMLPLRAEREGNPYYLVQAEHRARRAMDEAEVLTGLCPSRKSELAELNKKIHAALSALPGPDRRAALARQVCTRLGKKLTPELETACAGANFSPAILYSLDRALKTEGAQ